MCEILLDLVLVSLCCSRPEVLFRLAYVKFFLFRDALWRDSYDLRPMFDPPRTLLERIFIRHLHAMLERVYRVGIYVYSAFVFFVLFLILIRSSRINLF